MKKSEIFFSAILVPLDYCVVVLGILLAYYLRFDLLANMLVFQRSGETVLSFSNYFYAALFIAGLLVLTFAFEGLYAMKTTRTKAREFYKIIIASSAAFLVVVIFLFFKRETFSSRFIIVAGWFLTVFFVSFIRIVVRFVQSKLAVKKGIGMHRVLIVGKNKTSKTIVRKFKKEPGLGYRVVKILEDFNWKKLKRINKKKGIDEIIQCDPDLLKSKINMLVRFSDIYKIDYKYIPNLYDAHATNVNISQIVNFPVIELNKTPLDGWGKVIKRTFDILFTIIFILVFSPLYLLIALLIKLDSRGPVFYKDYRCGYRKEKFVCYKFRSLETELCDGEFGTKEGNKFLKKLEKDQNKNTRKGGPLHKIKDDPRITCVGKVIRRYSLDEIPNFFNVLKGEMSVVGYRPHMTYEVDKYNYDQQRMFYIKPGITGLAQISGRSDLDFDEEVRLDVYYMENWSLLMDILIIFKTPFVLFKRRKVE
jgi:exopolysaccharide biosynthesis polyprenyl glycosylphosphotransferase